MVRLLLVVAIIALVYWLLKVYRRSLERRESSQPMIEETMVRCDHCGVHLPRSESVSSEGRFYCSTDHRRLHES